ncbi:MULTISPECIES: hypothetical protein [Luteimonas]|uniref:hypothetical protein n=1 Tax=Luteimonas TaxID=83614 RepID=UPI000C7A4530|nr:MULTISPECIES: hypothetical protein [Luteimonas]
MIWRDFDQLLPHDPLLVAVVLEHNADGTSTVQFPNGSTLRVRGQGVPEGGHAFIRAGEIRGPAPAVTPVELEV